MQRTRGAALAVCTAARLRGLDTRASLPRAAARHTPLGHGLAAMPPRPLLAAAAALLQSTMLHVSGGMADVTVAPRRIWLQFDYGR